MENTTCAALEEYDDIYETVPLNFMEDDMMWFASKLPGAKGALGAEEIDLHSWIIQFRCASEELRVVFVNIDYWMPPPPGTPIAHLWHVS